MVIIASIFSFFFFTNTFKIHNIALKSLKQDDYIPFYVEIAKREGLGPEFRDTLLREIEDLNEEDLE